MTKYDFKYNDNSKTVPVVEMHDIYNAVKIDKARIEGWIEELVEHLRCSPEEHMAFLESGDTLVLVTRQEEGKENFDIVVTTRRQHGWIHFE